MIEYKKIEETELTLNLFKPFIRHQIVTNCWRKKENQWVVEPISFIDDWQKEDYVVLIDYLKNTLATGGVLFGAFYDDELKGFASVEAELFGKNKEYLDLSSLHISEDRRGKGIGRQLFQLAEAWAKGKGAKKLYISAHSAVETQAFYQSVGCVEAVEYNLAHLEQEPFDCQLEKVL